MAIRKCPSRISPALSSGDSISTWIFPRTTRASPVARQLKSWASQRASTSNQPRLSSGTDSMGILYLHDVDRDIFTGESRLKELHRALLVVSRVAQPADFKTFESQPFGLEDRAPENRMHDIGLHTGPAAVVGPPFVGEDVGEGYPRSDGLAGGTLGARPDIESESVPCPLPLEFVGPLRPWGNLPDAGPVDGLISEGECLARPDDYLISLKPPIDESLVRLPHASVQFCFGKS